MDRGTSLVPLRYATFGFLAFLTTSFSWLIASLLIFLQPRRGTMAGRVGQIWGRSLLIAAGCRLEVRNPERLSKDEVRLLVANHSSFLDPPAMIATCPPSIRFILKRELAYLPFVGWYAKLAGHFLLDRKDPRAGQKIIDRAIDRARRYTLIPVVFPEGTRSADGKLQPLRAGAFKIAIEGGFPVQPIAIEGTTAVMPKGARGPRRPGRVVMHIGEPIPVEGLEGSAGRKVLATRVRQALLDLGVPDGGAAS